jgi:hypothetical protein
MSDLLPELLVNQIVLLAGMETECDGLVGVDSVTFQGLCRGKGGLLAVWDCLSSSSWTRWIRHSFCCTSFVKVEKKVNTLTERSVIQELTLTKLVQQNECLIHLVQELLDKQSQTASRPPLPLHRHVKPDKTEFLWKPNKFPSHREIPLQLMLI